MVTATRPTHHAPINVVRGPESAPAAELIPASGEAIDWDEELAHLVQTPSVEHSIPAMRSPATVLAHALVSFWKNLNGPAMSQRERTRQAIAEDRDTKYLTMTATRLV